MEIEHVSRVLSNAPEGRGFWHREGEIRSLKELRSELYLRGSSFFEEFKAEDKNHFITWIDDVFKDHVLVNSLSEAKSFTGFLKALDDRINYLDLWMKHEGEKEHFNAAYAGLYPFSIHFSPEHHAFETADEHSMHGASHVLKSAALDMSHEVKMLKDINLIKAPMETRQSFVDWLFRRN
jgi:hypothetical protein